MPREQDRHGGSLSDHASRHEHFEFARHRAGASSARCGDEQRCSQRRIAGSLAGGAHLAWPPGYLAGALLHGRRQGPQLARSHDRQYLRQGRRGQLAEGFGRRQWRDHGLQQPEQVRENVHQVDFTLAMQRKPPVFIVGAPRSGTTLLRNILNRHPALAICGETQFHRHVYSRRRAFGSLADPKNRERLVHEYLSTDRIKRLGMDLSKLREKLLREGDSYRAVFTCVMEHYAESHGKQRCGEKTPQHALFTETLCDWYPGATIIHLLRDPRDVVASLQRMPWASDSVVTNARVWVGQNVAAQRSSHRSGYLLVRYETLVNRPEEELIRICAHLDEEYSPLMLVPQEESIIYSERSK